MARVFFNGTRVDQPVRVVQSNVSPISEIMVNSSDGYFIDVAYPTFIKLDSDLLTIHSDPVSPEVKPLQWVDIKDKLVILLDSYEKDDHGFIIIIRDDPGVHKTGYPYYMELKGDARLITVDNVTRIRYEKDLFVQLNPDHALCISLNDTPEALKKLKSLEYRIRRLKNSRTNDHERGIKMGDLITIQYGQEHFTGIITLIRDNDLDSSVYIKELFGSDYRHSETVALLSDTAFTNHYPIFMIDKSIPKYITHVNVNVAYNHEVGAEIAMPTTTTLPIALSRAADDASALFEICEKFRKGARRESAAMERHTLPDGSIHSQRAHDDSCGFVMMVGTAVA